MNIQIYINKNTDTLNSKDCIYDEVKGLFNQTIELLNNIIRDISDKEFSMHVKVRWNKRADAFKFTPENYQLQNLIWNKAKIQLSSLKSIKILEPKVGDDISKYKRELINKVSHSYLQINMDKKDSNIINSSKSIRALNETSITLPEIDILDDNILNIIDIQYLANISKMLRNSIKIIGKWKTLQSLSRKVLIYGFRGKYK